MKANTIEEFLGTLQQSTVEAWKEHLKTEKYSAHIALNEFYEDIVELVDSLIEEYQGKYGVVKDLKNIMTSEKLGAIKYLEELRELTTEGRSELIDEKDTELHSDIDAILSLIDSTLYKLKELKEGKMTDLADFVRESIDGNSANVNESRDDLYTVAFNDFKDKDDLPILVTVSVPREYTKEFQKFLEKEAGNSVYSADGKTVDWELEW